MRSGLRNSGRRLAVSYAISSLWLVSCRFGYEPLPQKSSSSSASSGGSSDGGAPANGGTGEASVPGGGSAGTTPLAGGTSSVGAASPNGGEQGQGGVGPSMAGESGDAGGPVGGSPNPGGCESTTDCTCDVFAAKSYWFCTTAAMSGAAELHCETQSMTLTRIDSSEENAFLFSRAVSLGMLPVGGYTLIGGNDATTDGQWHWRDGEQFWQGAANGSPVGGLYENWLDSSPTNSSIKACAGLVDSGEWQDRSCTAVVPYICAKSLL